MQPTEGEAEQMLQQALLLIIGSKSPELQLNFAFIQIADVIQQDSNNHYHSDATLQRIVPPFGNVMGSIAL